MWETCYEIINWCRLLVGFKWPCHTICFLFKKLKCLSNYVTWDDIYILRLFPSSVGLDDKDGHSLKKLGSTFFTFYWLALQKSPVVRVPWWNLFHLHNCTLRNISFCRYRSTDYVGQKKAIQSNNKAPRRALLFGAFVSFLMTVPAERPILCKIGKGTKLNEFTTELT